MPRTRKKFATQRKNSTPRAHVMCAYLASHEKYTPLYKKLAKWRTSSPSWERWPSTPTGFPND